MKQKVEEQYKQLAIEEITKVLREVPFVKALEIKSSEENDIIDFSVVINGDTQDIIFLGVEVKSKGEPRFARLFAYAIKLNKIEFTPVFMAPYISESSAKLLRENDCCYMDLSGNCHIATGGIYISVSGRPNKYIEKREGRNYFYRSSEAASKVLRTMLHEYKREWQVKTLSQLSNTSLGTVSNIKSFLLDREWVRETPKGFLLQNIKEMLYEWAKYYNEGERKSYEFYSIMPVSEIERAIFMWNHMNFGRAILSSHSAAVRYAPTVRYQRINVYVGVMSVNTFIDYMKLKAVPIGGNVIITPLYGDVELMYANTINNSIVASPVQTVLDLLGEAGRGEEAADAIIKKEFGE